MPGTDYSIHSFNPVAQGPAPAANAAEKEGFSFGDLLDIVNPLQHLPVVSTIYRHLTGDKIGLPEKIAGDGLYGGLMGLACSIGDALFEEITGKSVGDTVYAFVTGEGDTKTGVAAAPSLVTPASSTHLTLPSISIPGFSGMPDDDQTADAPPAVLSPLVARRASAAYGRASALQAALP